MGNDFYGNNNSYNDKDYKVKEKSSNTALIITIVILSIIALALGGYLIYTNYIPKDNTTNNVNNNENNPDSENSDEPIIDITSTEVVKILHEKIVAEDEYGMYFNELTNVDNISPEKMLNFVVSGAFRQDGFCMFDVNDLTEGVDVSRACEIPKNDIDTYIRNNFNTERIFSIKELDLNNWENLYEALILGDRLRRLIYANDTYYYGGIYAGGTYQSIETYITKAEEQGDYIYIYEKVMICDSEGGDFACYKSFDDDESNTKFYGCNISMPEGCPPEYYIGYDEMIEYVYEHNEDELNTYKHTFKKIDNALDSTKNDTYFWISSEIV